MECPFCSEHGFDEAGLKYHLIHHCDIYDSIDISGIKSLFSMPVSRHTTTANAEKCPNCVMGYLDIIIPRCSRCGYEKRC